MKKPKVRVKVKASFELELPQHHFSDNAQVSEVKKNALSIASTKVKELLVAPSLVLHPDIDITEVIISSEYE